MATETSSASAVDERADMTILAEISEKLGAVATRVEDGFKAVSERQTTLEKGLKETNDRVVEVRIAMAAMCKGGHGSDSTKPPKDSSMDAAADRQLLQKQQLLFKQMLTLIGLLVAAIGVLVAINK